MLFKRYSVVFLGNGISNLFLLLFEFVLAAKGAGRYGLYSICFSIIIIVSNISLLGFDFGTTRNIALFQKTNDDLKTATQIQVSVFIVGIIAIFAAVVIIIGAKNISTDIFHKSELGDYLILSALILILEAENQIMSAIFRGLRQFKNHVFVSGLLKNVFLLFCVPLLYFYPLSVNNILLFMFFGSLTSLIFGVYRLRKFLFRRINIESFFEITRMTFLFSYLLFIWNIFQKIAGQGQTLIAGAYLSTEEVGVFAIFFRIITVFTFIQSVINQSIFVEFSALNQEKERNRLERLFISNAEILLIISVILASPILINPEFLLSVFGNQYTIFSIWLIPLLLTQIVNIGTGPIGQLLISQEQQKSIILVSVLGGFTQITLSVIFLPKFGFPAAVISYSFTLLLMIVLRHILSKRHIKIHFLNFEFFYIFTSGMVCALLVARLGNIGGNDIVNLLSKSVISICIFVFLLYIYSFIDTSFKERMISYKSVIVSYFQEGTDL